MNIKCVNYIFNLLKSKEDSLILKKAIFLLFDNIKLFSSDSNQFSQYLAQFKAIVSNGSENKEKNKKNETAMINIIHNILRNILLTIGAFTLLDTFVESKTKYAQRIKQVTDATERLCNLQLIDPCCINNKDWTLYHTSAHYGNVDIFNHLLEIDNDTAKYVTKNQTQVCCVFCNTFRFYSYFFFSPFPFLCLMYNLIDTKRCCICNRSLAYL